MERKENPPGKSIEFTDKYSPYNEVMNLDIEVDMVVYKKLFMVFVDQDVSV